MLLVAAGLLGTEDVCWLSFPQNVDDDGCGEEVECWNIPPHAGVEWPDEFECFSCDWELGCGFGSFLNKRNIMIVCFYFLKKEILLEIVVAVVVEYPEVMTY